MRSKIDFAETERATTLRSILRAWRRSDTETRACARVAAAVKDAEERGASKIQAWDAAWRDVYALADAVCARAMAGTLGETLDAKL